MTVEEWLGKDNQLGIDIWEKKYRQSGESFDEWLDRVSGGNSELKELIVSKKFLFGGRILSNRGVDNREAKVTLSNCFVRGTKVYTQNGYKNIESIKKGDLVLTHQNRFKPVNAIMNRVYSGAMQVITGYNFRKIICTANHKFLTENGWVEAKDINKDSYIKVASLKYEHENKKENLLNYIALSNNRFFEEIDGRVRIGTSFIGGNNAKGNKYGEWINKEVTINDDLIYVIGRWLGDGSITNRKYNANNSIFQIVFNENEEQQMLRCKTILENNFGITMCLSANHDQHTLILRCDNEILCEFFYRKFGKYCDGKRISEDLLPNMNWVIGLLDADGLVTDSGQIRLCLKNKRLLEQVKECLMLNNIVTTDVKKIVNNKTFSHTK